MRAATWALDRGVSVVICNGMQEKAIKTIMSGRKLGTFFTGASAPSGTVPVEQMAENGKHTFFMLTGTMEVWESTKNENRTIAPSKGSKKVEIKWRFGLISPYH